MSRHQSDFDCGMFSQRLREFIDREERRQIRGRKSRDYSDVSGDDYGDINPPTKWQRLEASLDNSAAEQQPPVQQTNNNNEALMKLMMEGFNRMQEIMTSVMTAAKVAPAAAV